MKKIILFFLITVIIIANYSPISTISTKSSFVAVVFDDSGSMRYANNMQKKDYIFANYALQNMVALMDEHDEIRIYPISGQKSRNIKKDSNLDNSTRQFVSRNNQSTYIHVIDKAIKDGGDYLKNNSNNNFWLVIITDGVEFYNTRNEVISNDKIDDIVQGYIEKSGLHNYRERINIAVLSIGNGHELMPVKKMLQSFRESGFRYKSFTADVTGNKAGDNIIHSMQNIANYITGSHTMTLNRNNPVLNIRYPLKELMIMEQKKSSIVDSSIDGVTYETSDGTNKDIEFYETYYTSAMQPVDLTSVFSSTKNQSQTTRIEPGKYTFNIKQGSKADINFIPIVAVNLVCEVKNENNEDIGNYADDEWHMPPDYEMFEGQKLIIKAEVMDFNNNIVGGMNNITYELDSQNTGLNIKRLSNSTFEVSSNGPVSGDIWISAVDREYFQLYTQPLTLNFTKAPQFNNNAIEAVNGSVVKVEYTDQGKYIPVKEYTMDCVKNVDSNFNMYVTNIPKGIAIKFNDALFDQSTSKQMVKVNQNNNLVILRNNQYKEKSNTQIPIDLGNSQKLELQLQPKPREMIIQTDPENIQMDIPLLGFNYHVPVKLNCYIYENNRKQPLTVNTIQDIQIKEEGKYKLVKDLDNMTLRIGPKTPIIFTKTGEQELNVYISTGYPGEVQTKVVNLTIRDQWRWLRYVIIFIIIVVLLWYIIGLIKKPRFNYNYHFEYIVKEKRGGKNMGDPDEDIRDLRTNIFKHVLIPYKPEEKNINGLLFRASKYNKSMITLPKTSQVPDMIDTLGDRLDDEAGKKDIELRNGHEISVVEKNGLFIRTMTYKYKKI